MPGTSPGMTESPNTNVMAGLDPAIHE
jgi:hypothetical protein